MKEIIYKEDAINCFDNIEYEQIKHQFFNYSRFMVHLSNSKEKLAGCYQ